MRRVGILGGTFDPVHNGHLLLGEQAHREYGLDEIWFMPSHVPPHKKDHHITDGAARIRMLELATESVPYFSVSDFEMGREGNTYTAQTLALLKEAYPDIEVYFIIGADSLSYLRMDRLPELSEGLPICTACFSGAYPEGHTRTAVFPLKMRFLTSIKNMGLISGSSTTRRSRKRPRISGNGRRWGRTSRKTRPKPLQITSGKQDCTGNRGR